VNGKFENIGNLGNLLAIATHVGLLQSYAGVGNFSGEPGIWGSLLRASRLD
jgi:hypothetical protein